MTSAVLTRFSKLIEKQFSQGQYYEASHSVVSAYSRCNAGSDDARSFLYLYIIKFVTVAEWSIACTLASKYISSITDASTITDVDLVGDVIVPLFEAGQHVSIIQLYKETKGLISSNQIHSIACKSYTALKQYGSALRVSYRLVDDDPSSLHVLQLYIDSLSIPEKDLCLCRALLLLLCTSGSTDRTKALFVHMSRWWTERQLPNTPLLTFTGLLIDTCSRGAAVAHLYALLQRYYQPSILRDPELPSYLSTINNKFFTV